MRLRLFGKEIYISVWIKVIFIILVIAGLSAFGFWVEKNKKPAAFSEIPAAGSLPYLPESENNSFLKNEYSFNSSEASSAAGTPSYQTSYPRQTGYGNAGRNHTSIYCRRNMQARRLYTAGKQHFTKSYRGRGRLYSRGGQRSRKPCISFEKQYDDKDSGDFRYR